MNVLLENLIEVAPLFAEVLQQDVAIAISDMEQYLAFYETDTLKYPFPVGTKIKEAGFDYIIDEIYRTGEPVVDIVSREVTGSVDIKTIIAPVMDQGEMVGCISLSINIEKEAEFDNYASMLRMSVNAANKSIHNAGRKDLHTKQFEKMKGQLHDTL
ncbi:hypothetical protein [[Clostridium] polysaccharolyticum]|uniref:GAF domain-containing protein n=1 Tax=[Clostridium] polysaccharolyticum TaxID=29364 RepID=A0A1I0CY02_9FIRM|nr:hypothetical protein [[Clostridium] polysaccharolyticum]SET24641.1 hypothetical protein SAMN04487772_11213 [[Clostridium] polysaccharolyticum]